MIMSNNNRQLDIGGGGINMQWRSYKQMKSNVPSKYRAMDSSFPTTPVGEFLKRKSHLLWMLSNKMFLLN
jgi:hypothetical protein